jgi:hypothetical protein
MTLRNDFDSITLEVIREFARNGRNEDLHLDFKTIADARLSRDDRKSLAIALSGYANSDGGLIVWGVEARPNADGVDCAVALREIPEVQLLLTRLNSLTGQSVSPLVDGVDHKAIVVEGAAGVCVSYIPASDSGPHMAKGGEDRYFKRSGSSFYRMEHFDLEDMFGRRQRPSLSLRIDLVPRPSDDPHEEVHFSIINVGRGVAKHAGFMCRFDPDVKVAGVGGGQLNNVTGLNRGAPIVSYQDSVGVIHPNSIASSAGHAIILRNAKGEPLRIRVTSYCENMQARTDTALISPGTVSA